MKNVLLILLSILLFSCGSKTDEIEYGTFDFYVNNLKIGTIYRVNNYQYEVFDSGELIAKIEHKTDSTYLMSSILKNPTGIDTIIWLNTYKKLSDTKYRINAKPYNSTIDYQLDGILVKVDKNVPKIYVNKLNEIER